MTIDKEGWLSEPSIRDPSPNFTPHDGSRGIVRDTAMIHFTAGRKAGDLGTLKDDTKPMVQRVSAHFWIGQDGEVRQLVSIRDDAWHAGLPWDARSIGIELCNWGSLTKDSNGVWRSWAGSAVMEQEVIVARHFRDSEPKGWERFPPSQMGSLTNVLMALVDSGVNKLSGHEDFHPQKRDPGPAFPWFAVNDRVFG